MRFIIKKKIYYKLFDMTGVIVVIIAVLVSLISPQVVDAYTQGMVDSIMNMSEGQVSEVSFPESLDIEPRRIVWTTMTAYSSDVAQTDNTPCIPASGLDLCKYYEKYGVADTSATNFLPLGTQVRFPDLYGDKIFVVRDRMNARYGWGRGDFWMPSYSEAKKFGVKRIKMEIYYR